MPQAQYSAHVNTQCDSPISAVPFKITPCLSHQSYHDQDDEEEDIHLASVIVAGASVTSGHDVSQPEEEKQSPRDGLEGEEKEDLPEQPAPIEEKPKEGKD